MRITVGHIFILLMIGLGVYFFSEPIKEYVNTKKPGVIAEIKSLLGLFKEGERETNSSLNDPTKDLQAPVSSTAAAVSYSTPPISSSMNVATSTTPTKHITGPDVSGESIKERKKVRTTLAQNRKRKKPATTLTKGVSQKSKPKAKDLELKPNPPPINDAPEIHGLVGTYVALELKTGRVVKGILEGKSDKEYTVQLPGLGPFTYPIKDVSKITKAE